MAKKLNREDRRALNTMLEMRRKEVFANLSDDTQELWDSASKSLGWVRGKPIVLPSGIKIDLAMFDFVISQCVFTAEDQMSDLKMLEKFWVTLSPYTQKMVENMEFYIAKFKEVEKVETEVLRKYALQNMELQYLRIFMKEKVPAGYGEKFKVYYAQKKAESDAEIEKIKLREKAFLKKKSEGIQKKLNEGPVKKLINKVLGGTR